MCNVRLLFCRITARLFLGMLLFGGVTFSSTAAAINVSLSTEETRLYELVNEYRAENGLSAIPLSSSLTYVAQAHVRDLQNYPPSGNCNMHSWSSNGAWSSCCYTPDHAQAQCMWDKPRELTDYPGNGYENAFGSSGYTATAQAAFDAWKNSSGHNAVILNQGVWNRRPWNALGVGIDGGYAVLWFGEEVDPASHNNPTTYNFSIIKAGTGTGSLTGSTPDGQYAAGTPISIVATPNEGSVVSYSPGCSASFEMPAQNLVCTVTFTPATYNFSIIKAGTGTGSVTGSTPDGQYAAGTPISIVATPEDGSAVSYSPGCSASFEMPAQDLVCTVTFTPATYNFSIIKAGTGTGSLTGSTPDGQYAAGTPISIVATPEDGSAVSYSHGCSASFEMPAQNLVCTVTFTAINPPVTEAPILYVCPSDQPYCNHEELFLDCNQEAIIRLSHTEGAWKLIFNGIELPGELQPQASYGPYKNCNDSWNIQLQHPEESSVASNLLEITWDAAPKLWGRVSNAEDKVRIIYWTDVQGLLNLTITNNYNAWLVMNISAPDSSFEYVAFVPPYHFLSTNDALAQETWGFKPFQLMGNVTVSVDVFSSSLDESFSVFYLNALHFITTSLDVTGYGYGLREVQQGGLGILKDAAFKEINTQLLGFIDFHNGDVLAGLRTMAKAIVDGESEGGKALRNIFGIYGGIDLHQFTWSSKATSEFRKAFKLL